MSRKVAIIDLGTNTFQLLVAEKKGSSFHPVYRKSTPSRLGKGGINQHLITEEAMTRALSVLADFRQELARLAIPAADTFVFGTSAVRNAANKALFLREVEDRLHFPVQVIDGATEAHFIYLGVREAVSLGDLPHLVMDIGGGSVEFIIADHNRVYWKRSFEIGGQRLIERFVKSDPISPVAIRQIRNFLDQSLIPLSNAIHQYSPALLAGSSGSFETVVDIDYWQRFHDWPPDSQNGFDLPVETFRQIRNLVVSSDRAERMQIPGMKELRVDMIGVGICLIDYILETYRITGIKVSRYSLKEGILSAMMRNDETRPPGTRLF